MAGRSIYPPSVKPGIPKIKQVPKGWRKVPFGDVLDVVSRPANLEDDKEYQLVNAKRSRGGIVPRTRLLAKQIKTKTQFHVAAGDFLISRRQIVHGACGIVPPTLDGALVSNEYSSLVAKDGLSLDYLAWYSHTTHFQQTCFHASVGVAVEKMVFKLDDWLKHEFLVPPTNEQKAICSALNAWEQAITFTVKLIDAKRRLKKGLAQQLLTGEHRLPGFNGQWKNVSIGDISQCSAGGTPSTREPKYWGGSVLWAKSGDVHKRIIFSVDGRITDLGLNNSSAKVFPPNTILVALAGQGKTRGTVALTKVHLATNQSLAGIQCDPDTILPEYLFHNLAWRYGELRLLSKGDGGRGGLTLSLIKSVLLRLPRSLEEQERIADVLGAADREVVLLEKRLAALREQKRGLIQKLLSGQVRLKGGKR